MSKLTDFLLNGGPDNKGRTLKQILTENDVWFEDTHDFIQWILPTSEPSQYNLTAPVLTCKDCFLLGSENTEFIGNFELIIARFKTFIHNGLSSYAELGVANHNHLRITRFLKCLMIFDYDYSANQYLNYLRSQKPLAGSLAYWEYAVKSTDYV